MMKNFFLLLEFAETEAKTDAYELHCLIHRLLAIITHWGKHGTGS
jgi:hypothetical protein